MVAISLYRGNLHRVPDVPRRWLMPTPKISLRDFKILLNRRSRALSRLGSTTIATTSRPSSSPSPNLKHEEGAPDIDAPSHPPKLAPRPKLSDPGNEPLKREPSSEEEVKDGRKQDGPVGPPKRLDGSDTAHDTGPAVAANTSNPVDECDNSEVKRPTEKLDAEASNKLDALTDQAKRKKEVEEKLRSLKAKKHNLVQVLKQIQNAEEELKRRNSIQGMAIRPSVPLQVDLMNDSGSMTRHPTPRMSSEGNLGGDIEGGEADDVSNHNTHSRHLLRMSSTSPSSDSPHRRSTYIQHNVVSHTSRANVAVVGSPSRFAPTGHQGHTANLPGVSVSVSGTNYVASSPSPAASGGTSVFRDRLPSPWN